MTSFEVSAVLFDMDGTLVDSTEVVEKTWTLWAIEQGLNPAEVVAFAHGRPTADTIRAVAPHIDAVTEAARLLAEEELDPTPVRTIPGAYEAVALVNRHVKWAVVTSASTKLANLRLTAAGYPTPPVLISADDIVQGKPHPEGFLKAAGLLNVSAADCLVFEDTPAGLLAGKAAGATVIGLSTTFLASALPADTIVADFRAVRFEPRGGGRLRISV